VASLERRGGTGHYRGEKKKNREQPSDCFRFKVGGGGGGEGGGGVSNGGGGGGGGGGFNVLGGGGGDRGGGWGAGGWWGCVVANPPSRGKKKGEGRKRDNQAEKNKEGEWGLFLTKKNTNSTRIVLSQVRAMGQKEGGARVYKKKIKSRGGRPEKI